MDIFKRPMFYAAAVCCTAAILSLFVKILSFIFLGVAIIGLLLLSFGKNKKVIFIAVIIALFLISLLFQFNKIKKTNAYDGQTIEGEFLVLADIVEYDKFNTITLKPIKSDTIPNNIKLLIFDYKKTALLSGDIVDATLKISAIEQDDEYRISDYSSGIFATANVKKIEKTRCNKFYKIFGSMREYVNKTLSRRFDKDTAGLLCALTTGDKSLISDDFSHNIKTTGISHVVVVSGMHLSIIISAVFFVIDKLFYNKYLRCVLSIFFIFLIVVVCGFTMSVIRAAATFIIASFAPILNRENDSLNSLLAAITFILVADPFAIFNVSFLLSILSTLAIIWVVPVYSNFLFTKLKIKSNIMQKIIQIFLCCLFANIFTLPISIKTFGYMSIVSPITNICITYFVTCALILNIVAMLLIAMPLINYLGELFLALAGLCAKFIVFIVNKIAELPVTVAVLPKSAFYFSILIIFIVITVMYCINAKSKKEEVIKCQ